MSAIKHRIEWNGRENILVLENGHDRLDIGLDEFLTLADDIRRSLLLPVDPPEPHRPAPRRPR